MSAPRYIMQVLKLNAILFEVCYFQLVAVDKKFIIGQRAIKHSLTYVVVWRLAEYARMRQQGRLLS
jgi:hypothetical protein